MNVTLRLMGADLSVCKLSDARQADLGAGFFYPFGHRHGGLFGL